MAGRPASSVGTISKHLTKAEKAIREATENNLKGNGKLIAPDHLNEAQKSIFDFIVSELQESNVLGSLDVYVLEKAAVAIERSRYMEQQMNENPELLTNATFVNTKSKYDTVFLKMVQELALSPSSRAKIAIANVKTVETKNPLLSILEDDEDDE